MPIVSRRLCRVSVRPLAVHLAGQPTQVEPVMAESVLDGRCYDLAPKNHLGLAVILFDSGGHGVDKSSARQVYELVLTMLPALLGKILIEAGVGISYCHGSG